VIQLVIEGKPASKKNSVRIARRRDGTPFVLPSAVAGRWGREAVRQLRQQYQGAPLTGPLAVTYRIYRQNNQHEADLGNYVNAIDDALQAAGVITNDRLIVASQASKSIDPERARVEVTIHAVAEVAA
jgi:Holliday junction resolvase RusA-like endonuclease